MSYLCKALLIFMLVGGCGGSANDDAREGIAENDLWEYGTEEDLQETHQPDIATATNGGECNEGVATIACGSAAFFCLRDCGLAAGAAAAGADPIAAALLCIATCAPLGGLCIAAVQACWDQWTNPQSENTDPDTATECQESYTPLSAATDVWANTGSNMTGARSVTITVSDTAFYASGATQDANGASPSQRGGGLVDCPARTCEAGCGSFPFRAVMGKFGLTGYPFVVGSYFEGAPTSSGNLYLILNDCAFDDNSGEFDVHVTICSGDAVEDDPPCEPRWNCSAWSDCLCIGGTISAHSRTCTDLSGCEGTPAVGATATTQTEGCNPCGNGACDCEEMCTSCPQDCGACPPPASCTCPDSDGDGHYGVYCSDARCTPRDDCEPLDGAIHPGAYESCDGVNNDCDSTVDEGCSRGPVCGNGTCEGGEGCSSCAVDCGSCPPVGPVCGNGACETGEDCTWCGDCPCPPTDPGSSGEICGNEVDDNGNGDLWDGCECNPTTAGATTHCVGGRYYEACDRGNWRRDHDCLEYWQCPGEGYCIFQDDYAQCACSIYRNP